MNKIRKYLIHLLGGVTKEECNEEEIYYSKVERACAIQRFKWKMESCYGLTAERWCKRMYEYTCKQYERAMKDLEEYADGLNG